MKFISTILPCRRQCIQALSFCVVVLLAGCETPGLRDSAMGLENRAEAQAEAGNFRSAAQLYERLAAGAAGSERDRHLMAAAQSWYYADDRSRAMHDMRAVNRPYPADLTPVQAILAAASEVESGAPRDALSRLARLPEDVTREISADATAIGARAWFNLGNARRGVETLIERELWLENPAQIEANQRLIWDGLRSVGKKEIPADADNTLAGWLALGNSVAETAGDPFAERAALLRWRETWPRHPAAAVLLRQLIDDYGDVLKVPQRVALLLPLSGRLETVGAALRDGFFAAYFDYAAATDPAQIESVQIVTYDTESYGAAEAYRLATREGADFIAGPLTKDAVIEVAALSAAGPPTLALNYLPDQDRTSGHFYQFALAPEHEARRVAQRALAEGQLNAVALVPGDAWGQRILDAFADELEQHGGTLLTHQVYDPESTDFASTIRPMLHLDRSRARHRALVNALGRKLEFEPRRRQDVDFIFFAAMARQARQIRPQLRFHYAADLPVYATAAAFDPDPSLNRDIEGLIFASTPWEIGASSKSRELLAVIERNWPQRSQHRSSLFAMGYDAWRLAPLLTKSTDEPLALHGLTGDLTLGADGRVMRAPALGRIHQGLAMPLPELETGPTTLDDLETPGAMSSTATKSKVEPAR